jgi:signal peptidase II
LKPNSNSHPGDNQICFPLKKPLAIIFLVLFIDQVVKIYIKTHYCLGESHAIFGSWSYLFFIENEGMAFGWKFFGSNGKLILSLFRIAAAIGIFYYLMTLVRRKVQTGMIIAFALIFAGATGNIIDSMFYGMLFTNSTLAAPAIFSPGNGYAGFLHGRVVDMLYFPLIDGYWPQWALIPSGLRGQHFQFFRPIFNVADSSITIGVCILLLFQKRFFHQQPVILKKEEVATSESEISPEPADIRGENTPSDPQ